MKRKMYHILSLLLCLALLLPLYPTAARGATVRYPAYDLDLTSSADTLYFGQTRSYVTLTATADPTNYDGIIEWELRGNVDLVEVDSDFYRSHDYRDYRTVTVYPVSSTDSGRTTGTVTVRATVYNANGRAVNRDYTLTIRDDAVTSCTLSVSKTTLRVGDTALCTVRTYYSNGSSSTGADVTYSSSAPSVVRVSSSGQLTAVASGRAAITATVGGKSSTVTVTVSGSTGSSDVDDTASLGENYSMRKVYNELYARYVAKYSSSSSAVYPSDRAEVRFDIPSSSDSVALLYDSANRPVEIDDRYDFIDMETMYLLPSAEGDYVFTCTVTDGSRSLTADIIIRVEKPTRYIRIAVSSGTDYAFSAADTSGKTGVQLVNAELGSYASIRFGEILSGDNVGTLYTSSQLSAANRVGNRTVVLAADVEKLYFTPSRAGSFRITYDAYSNNEARGNPLSSGELIIAVDAASKDLTVKLDTLDAYTFSSRPRSGEESVATLLRSAIDDAIGSSSWYYLRLTPPANNQIGTLHETSSTRRELASSDYIYYQDIGNLYFTPSRAGNYELRYDAYYDNKSSSSLISGKLTLVVSTVPTGSADISYTTSVNGKVTLSESDFFSFFQEARSRNYYLSCVVFDDYNGQGTFQHSSSSFVPYNSADYYTRTFTGKESSNPRYLDQVSFTAPAASGYTVVKFTCYGGTNSDSTNVTQSGTLYIFYTASDVPTIDYNAYGVEAVQFREADFASAYQIATNSALTSPKFSIRLLTLPTSGLLYHNTRFNNNSAYLGTRLTSSDLSRNTYTIGSTDKTYSVESLRYSALGTAAGSETLVYIAYDNSGNQLYTGAIRMKLTEDRTVTAGAEGYSFQLTDFYSSGSDPVVAVTFSKPASGKLFLADGGRWVEPEESARFYTVSDTAGAHPVSALRYVPRAGATGEVTLNYRAYRSTGSASDNTIKIKLTSSAASARFGDVSGVTGWAAGAIDFAAALSLVGGIGTRQFGPSLTMKRCDLVLILYRLAGEPSVTGTVPYLDVSSGVYYYASALWAGKNGIMDGVVSNNTYRPTGEITRQDFAQILYNYTKYTNGSLANTGDLSRYTDRDKVGANTIIGVTWAVGRGLITSTSSGYTIEPTRTATRAEIVTLLHRYLTY